MQVAIEEFAGGLLLGIGAFFIVAYNGLIVGVVIGLAVGNGHSALAAELLVPHGVLELSLNVVCAAAGARVGWAIVEPGSLTRLRAVQREARAAAGVLLGTPRIVVAEWSRGSSRRIASASCRRSSSGSRWQCSTGVSSGGSARRHRRPTPLRPRLRLDPQVGADACRAELGG